MNHLQHNLIQETHVTPSRDENIVDLVTDKHGLQCCQQTTEVVQWRDSMFDVETYQRTQTVIFSIIGSL